MARFIKVPRSLKARWVNLIMHIFNAAKSLIIMMLLFISFFCYGQRLAVKQLPKVLDNVDEFTYKAAIKAQNEGNFEHSLFFQRQIRNKILLPWLQYYWLVSPDNPDANLEHYRQFLENNRNHPFADDVYATGKNKYGNKLIFPKSKQSSNLPTIFAREKKYNIAKAPKITTRKLEKPKDFAARQHILTQYDDYIAKNQYSQAHKYLLSGAVKQEFSAYEIDQHMVKLARILFNDGQDDMAKNIALNIAKRHGDHLGESWWIAGLSSWRQQDYTDARRYFSELTNRAWMHENLLYGAYFWLARTYFILGEFEGWEYNLVIAANNSENFYSLIAKEILAKNNNYSYDQYKHQLTELLKEQGKMQVFLALLQIGADEWAKVELWHQLQTATKDEQSLLLWIALELDFSYPQYQKWFKHSDASSRSDMLPRLPFRWQASEGLLIDEALLLAIIQKESNFSAQVKSSAGAYGLMQITEQTKKTALRMNNLKNNDYRLYSPKDNVYVGQLYLEYLLSSRQFDGNLFATLAGWNAGPTNARAWLRDPWRHADDPLFWLESIPFKETRLYVKEVTTNLWQYRKRVGQVSTSLKDVAQGKIPYYQSQD